MYHFRPRISCSPRILSESYPSHKFDKHDLAPVKDILLGQSPLPRITYTLGYVGRYHMLLILPIANFPQLLTNVRRPT